MHEADPPDSPARAQDRFLDIDHDLVEAASTMQ